MNWAPCLLDDGTPIEHYVVSDSGDVLSERRGRYLKGYNVGGRKDSRYLLVAVPIPNKQRHQELIHRLVAKGHIGLPTPDAVVNHLDGDKHNNAVSNLEWCDRQANVTHAWDTGLVTHDMYHRHVGTKLTADDVRAIRAKQGGPHGTGTRLAERYGVSVNTVYAIWGGRLWGWLQ